MIRDRLLTEAEINVAIRVTVSADRDSFELAGRGELQIGGLAGNYASRRLWNVCFPPTRFVEKDENDQVIEPYEEIIADIDDEYTGVVVEKLTERKADLTDMRPAGHGKTCIVFRVHPVEWLGIKAVHDRQHAAQVFWIACSKNMALQGDITGRRNLVRWSRPNQEKQPPMPFETARSWHDVYHP